MSTIASVPKRGQALLFLIQVLLPLTLKAVCCCSDCTRDDYQALWVDFLLLRLRLRDPPGPTSSGHVTPVTCAAFPDSALSHLVWFLS